MRALITFLVTLCLLQGQPQIDEKHYKVYRGDGRVSSLDELVREASTASVTFLGELHDDAVAHHLEEEILRRLYQPELALSLEMFETDVQQVVDEYLTGLVTEEHLLASGRAWKNYKTDYRPMIEFAKEKKMPVIAANAPRRYVNRVTRLGAASLNELDSTAKSFLPPLPYGTATPKYAEKFQRTMEEARREAEKSGGGPVRRPDPEKGIQAQSLWDAGMAFSIASFLTRHPGMRVLQCNGSFHSGERMGIPDHLPRYRPGVSMLVVTMISDKSFPAFDKAKMTGQGDFVIVTDGKLLRSYGSEPAKK